jgi:hypothetical protein
MHFSLVDLPQKSVPIRVARWHIFRPKIPIWVNFGGPCNGRCWYILWTFDLFYGYFVYYMDIRSILRLFCIFYVRLVYFVAIRYAFPHFGILNQEKSGNPEYDDYYTCTEHLGVNDGCMNSARGWHFSAGLLQNF